MHPAGDWLGQCGSPRAALHHPVEMIGSRPHGHRGGSADPRTGSVRTDGASRPAGPARPTATAAARPMVHRPPSARPTGDARPVPHPIVQTVRGLFDRVFPRGAILLSVLTSRLLRDGHRPQPGLRQHLRRGRRARRLQRRVPHPRDRARRPRRGRADRPVRADLQRASRRDDDEPGQRLRPDRADRRDRGHGRRQRDPVRPRPVAGRRASARASTRRPRSCTSSCCGSTASPRSCSRPRSLGEILVANRRFLFYALAPILYTGGIILGTVLFAERFGIVASAWGRSPARSPTSAIRRRAPAGRRSGSGSAVPIRTAGLPRVHPADGAADARYPIEPLTFTYFTILASSIGGRQRQRASTSRPTTRSCRSA